MSITKTIIAATWFLSFFACTHGAKDGLLRKKFFAVNDDTRIKNFRKLSLSHGEVQIAFRELLDNRNQMKWDISMSLSMSMSPTILPPSRPGATIEPTVSPVAEPPMTQVVNPVVTNTESTGEKQQKVIHGGLSGGAIAGMAMAAVAVIAVAAILAKKGPTQATVV